MKAKLGPTGATTATAHKIAVIFYTMITKQVEYNDTIWATRDADRQKRFEARVKRQAQLLGYQLVPKAWSRVSCPKQWLRLAASPLIDSVQKSTFITRLGHCLLLLTNQGDGYNPSEQSKQLDVIRKRFNEPRTLSVSEPHVGIIRLPCPKQTPATRISP
jgi:hypothetical protein